MRNSSLTSYEFTSWNGARVCSALLACTTRDPTFGLSMTGLPRSVTRVSWTAEHHLGGDGEATTVGRHLALVLPASYNAAALQDMYAFTPPCPERRFRDSSPSPDSSAGCLSRPTGGDEGHDSESPPSSGPAEAPARNVKPEQR